MFISGRRFRRSLVGSLSLSLFAADLPVRQVTLYKHGIGFFERAGSVPAGEELRLDFKNTDMNDGLKSLTVSEAGGGKVSGIRYDSNATLEQQLEKYPFTIGSGEMLSSFLDRIKGAHLEVKVADRTLSGAILGARAILEGPQDNRRTSEQVTLLLDSGDVSNLDLGAVATMRLLDPHLQDQLRQYLQTLSEAKSKDKRSIYIDSTGSTARGLHVSYITPTAIWKSSYRLTLDLSSPSLEGWAIVDNTTDEDWNNVRLSVVSGRPISFISQLDTPRYGNRQVAELPEDRAAGPVVYGGAVGEGRAGGMGDGVVGGVIGGVPAPQQFAANELMAPKARPGPATQTVTVAGTSSVAGATGATLGELFEYNFPGPVTIKKNQSAMLPFLQDKISARKLLIWTSNDGEHPVNAAEVTNNTVKTLDGGPITVFDSGAYAGEALFETLKAGDKRLIGYAVDYGTRVETDNDDGPRILRDIGAKNGVLNLRYAERQSVIYRVKNVDAKTKTLIVQQEANDYKIISPKPMERTSAAYRFEVQLAANGTQELKVEQEHVISETTAVSTATPDLLISVTQNHQISDSGKRQIEAITALKSRMIETQSALDTTRTQMGEFTEDQNRLRQNIDSLNRVKGEEDQVRQYSSKLAANEAKLAMLRDRRSALTQKKTALDAQLNEVIIKLNF